MKLYAAQTKSHENLRCVDQILPRYLIRAVFMAARKAVSLWVLIPNKTAIRLLILAARCVGADYARVNLKFRQALPRRSGLELY